MWNRLGKLPDEIIFNLNKYYDENKHKLKIKDNYNVKNVRTLGLNHIDNPDILEAGIEIYDLLNNKSLNPSSSYILEYYENSFTCTHVDLIGDEETNSITTVTLLHKSNDLLGGEILITDKKEKSIVILNQDIGEIISYSHRVPHGVSKVLKGTRRVLINWYKSKTDNIR